MAYYVTQLLQDSVRRYLTIYPIVPISFTIFTGFSYTPIKFFPFSIYKVRKGPDAVKCRFIFQGDKFLQPQTKKVVTIITI